MAKRKASKKKAPVKAENEWVFVEDLVGYRLAKKPESTPKHRRLVTLLVEAADILDSLGLEARECDGAPIDLRRIRFGERSDE